MEPDAVRNRIAALVADHHVVLFMKGTRSAPQCGFSAEVVRILEQQRADYETIDVLQSPELREGIKKFSSWPTIPQLYVGGKFVGGCDIVRELNQSGELATLMGGAPPAPIAPPSIVISDRAARAFRDALEGAGQDVLALAIDERFQHDLFVGPPKPNWIEVEANGVSVWLDRASVRRAEGLRIDFVESPNPGFKLDNPNQPPGVRPLGVADAQRMLERGELTLFDVRPEAERRIASIAGSHALEGPGVEHLRSLDRKTPIAFYCHHGIRSRAVAEQVIGEGFEKVFNLEGGIEAWSVSVDPSVPRY